MQKLALALTVATFSVISTTAVYAVITWDDDPAVPIGDGYWAHLQSGVDDKGEVVIVLEEVAGEIKDDRVWAKGCTEFKGGGETAIRVWITKEENGPALGEIATTYGQAPGRLCAQMTLPLN